jgi:hypothetical protein
MKVAGGGVILNNIGNGGENFDFRGMPELTGEAIVLRHPEHFEPAVAAAAKQRLIDTGVDVSAT